MDFVSAMCKTERKTLAFNLQFIHIYIYICIYICYIYTHSTCYIFLIFLYIYIYDICIYIYTVTCLSVSQLVYLSIHPSIRLPKHLRSDWIVIGCIGRQIDRWMDR